MEQVTVGARELKARLGRYLQIVRDGGTVTITDRGETMARIVPARREKSLEERTLALVRAGLLEWGGGELEDIEPPAKLIGDKTVAELLVEDRELDW